MIRFANQRDPGSVSEKPMRNGFSIKPKNKEASKSLTPQNIKQESKSTTKLKVHSKTTKANKNINPMLCINKNFTRGQPKHNRRTFNWTRN